MQLISKKNFLVFLAALLVVALGFMALTLARKDRVRKPLTASDREIMQIEKQSQSDNVDVIEKDLNETDTIDLDKELQDIENEIETAY